MAPVPMCRFSNESTSVPKRLSPAKWDQSYRRIYFRVNLHVAKEVPGPGWDRRDQHSPVWTHLNTHSPLYGLCCACIALKITKHIIYILDYMLWIIKHNYMILYIYIYHTHTHMYIGSIGNSSNPKLPRLGSSVKWGCSSERTSHYQRWLVEGPLNVYSSV